MTISVGSVIKTIIPQRNFKFPHQSDWIVAIGIILEPINLYSFGTEKFETHYRILIQNAGVVERHPHSIYPLDTPDKLIIDKENELPF